MRKYKEYSDEEFIVAVKESKSVAQVLKKLNLKPCGGNYYTTKKMLSKLNLDCSHWTGQGWNKNEQLKDWSNYSKVEHLKKHLVKLRGCQCEECTLTEWLCQPITLEVHHQDGDRTNNNLENLKLLCPNCHAQTKNWRGKKNGGLNGI